MQIFQTQSQAVGYIFKDEVEEETQDLKEVIIAELGRYMAELKQ